MSWEKYDGSYPIKMAPGFNLFLKPGCQYSEKRFLYKVAEENEIDFLKNEDFENNVCLDIGANIGYWACFLLAKVGKGEVHTFEPNPDTFKILKKNIESNFPGSRAIVNNLALGEENGSISLFLNPYHSGDDRTIFTEGRTQIAVKQMTLDSYVESKNLKALDFVKIDVQGAELSVLKGGIKSLKTFAPRILMEWTPGEFKLDTTFFGDFFGLAKVLDWTFWCVKEGKLSKLELEADPFSFAGNIIIDSVKGRKS
ncbi:MAG: FkbM family methyltransferase [Bdellovibrionota bacterium]